MKKLTSDELKKMLRQADIKSAVLKMEKLTSDKVKKMFGEFDAVECADLAEADLNGVDLHGECLNHAWLSSAGFRRANLNGAHLNNVCAHWTDFSYADLRGAGFIDADLYGAMFYAANLSGATFIGADLRRASFCGADLSGADFKNACLDDADFRGAKNVPYIPLACPSEGPFIAWKQCQDLRNDRVIVKLLIPQDAKRSSGTTNKCRSDKAVVLEIQTFDGKKMNLTKAWSLYNPNFRYEVGKIVEPLLPFCEDRFNECASGIHFYVNRQDAVDY